MSLYDDTEVDSKGVAGWSSGIKMLQSHVQLRKATGHHLQRKGAAAAAAHIAPVLDLNTRTKDRITAEDMPPIPLYVTRGGASLLGGDWFLKDEYDPSYPNEYDRLVKQLRRENNSSSSTSGGGSSSSSRKDKRSGANESSNTSGDSPGSTHSSDGGSGGGGSGTSKRQSAMIAPPPSLSASSDNNNSSNATSSNNNNSSMMGSNSVASNGGPGTNGNSPAGASRSVSPPASPHQLGAVSAVASNMGCSSVAAKIMARMGFKAGQGLGKSEQGIASALSVEKTSHRGGKIVDMSSALSGPGAGAGSGPGAASLSEMPPPGTPGMMLASGLSDMQQSQTDSGVMGPPPPISVMGPPPPPPVPAAASAASTAAALAEEQSITEILRNPTKVVLLRNMVGPGEVDEELEPETKEECGRYGEVVKCVIYELPGPGICPEEAVRIFVEYKSVAHAIKAVVDLNGRFFGGRVVRASFYEQDKFNRLELI